MSMWHYFCCLKAQLKLFYEKEKSLSALRWYFLPSLVLVRKKVNTGALIHPGIWFITLPGILKEIEAPWKPWSEGQPEQYERLEGWHLGQLKFYWLVILEETVADLLPVDSTELENKSSVTFRETYHFATSQQPDLHSFPLLIICITPLYFSSSLFTSKKSHSLLPVKLCKHDMSPPEKSKWTSLRRDLYFRG